MAINFTRRRLLAGAAAAAAAGFLPSVRAQGFPSGNLHVDIPTRQGGGAERLARSFDAFWAPLLKTQFEYDFYPGAGGQVGYEVYLQKREKNGYNLLFGNMGPETIMYVLQNPPYSFEDYQYFCRMDVDDSSIFVRRDSPFKRIEDVVAEAKKRTINVAVSRLPHPASIGVLALGRATKGKFNLIPYGGGNPTQVAVLSGEVDCGALPIAGIVALSDQLRILTVFNDDFKLGHHTNNAPAVNKVFGTNIPNLPSSRSWAVHSEVLDKYPDRFAVLEKTSRQVFADPAFKEAYKKTGAPVETLQYGDRTVCDKYARSMIALAKEYRPLLTGKKK